MVMLVKYHDDYGDESIVKRPMSKEDTLALIDRIRETAASFDESDDLPFGFELSIESEYSE